MKLLLISNSGRPYLGHCKEQIFAHFRSCKKVGVVTAAYLGDGTELFQKITTALEGASFQFTYLNADSYPLASFESCDGIMVSGGNTYRLLQKLIQSGLLAAIRERVQKGMPFAGWSAGANIAGPTILTTNDWNVVGLSQFAALNLVPFNINPHYIETDPRMAPFSETRDERIGEYHRVNSNPVYGIEEQTILFVEGSEVRVLGSGKIRKFEPGRAPVDFRNGDAIR
jgi:dipeptidase E